MHPLYLVLRGDYAGLLNAMGDKQKADAEFRKVMELGRRSPIRWHPVMIEGLMKYGDELRDRGDTQEAKKVYLEAMEVARKVHWQVRVDQLEEKLAGLRQPPPVKDAAPPRPPPPAP